MRAFWYSIGLGPRFIEVKSHGYIHGILRPCGIESFITASACIFLELNSLLSLEDWWFKKKEARSFKIKILGMLDLAI